MNQRGTEWVEVVDERCAIFHTVLGKASIIEEFSELLAMCVSGFYLGLCPLS